MRPILIFGYGNPARGDDALGPELVQRLERLQGQANQDQANRNAGAGRGPIGFRLAAPPIVSHTVKHSASDSASEPISATPSDAGPDDVARTFSLADVDFLTDSQLQPEHALDIAGRVRVLLVDAAVGLEEPYRLDPVNLYPASSYTTHYMSPGTLLGVHVRIGLGEPPLCHLMSIRGYRFELGHTLSEPARNNLDLAEQALLRWLDRL